MMCSRLRLLRALNHRKVITPTQRRRLRKGRAAARRNLWLHRRGYLVLTPFRIAQAVKRLSKHHSADHQFLDRFSTKRLGSSRSSTMEELVPWRCKWCYRIMKAKGVKCLTTNCGQRWEQCWDPAYVFQPRKQPEWKWPTPPSPSPSQKAKKDKSNAASREGSRSKKNQKDKEPANDVFKGWGKGKKGQSGKESPFGGPLPYAMSPFAYPMSYFGQQCPQIPWAPPESKGADSVTQPVDKDFMAAFKASFPDASKAPQALRDYYEKSEAQTSKSLTSEMHRTTTALGKIRKELQQLNEARTSHRRSWLQHLALSAQSWQAQLKEYEETQSNFGEKIQKATEELHTSHQLLQKLNAQAATTSLGSTGTPSIPDLMLESFEVPEASIGEEVMLRKKVQDMMEQCAKAIAAHAPPADAQQIDSDEDSARERERKRSRGEVLEPAAPNAPEEGSRDQAMGDQPDRLEVRFQANAYDRTRQTHRAACLKACLSPDEIRRHVHTTMLSDDCMYPWRAISNAHALASQVSDEVQEFWDAAFPDTLTISSAPTASESRLDSLDLAGSHDAISVPISDPIFDFADSEPCDRCANHHTRTSDITDFITDIPAPPERPPDNAPQWIHRGFHILDRHGFIPEHDGPSINVISWFLHGENRRDTAEYVRHRFAWDWWHWEIKLREIWRDHIDPMRPLHIAWIVADVPQRRTAVSSHWSQPDHHLVLFQAPRIEDLPVVATLMKPEASSPILMQEALFVPVVLDFRVLFNRLHLGLFHDHGVPQISVNQHRLTRATVLRDLPVGSSIVVAFRPLTSAFGTTVSSAAPVDGSLEELGDAMVLMQHDHHPHPHDPHSTPGESDESEMPDMDEPSSDDALTQAPEEDLQSTYVHTVGHNKKHAMVRWRSHDDMLFDVASILGISIHDIVAVYYKVHGYPCGTSESSNVLIAHRVNDKPPNANLRFALCDIVLHDTPQARTCGVNPGVERSVVLFQPEMTRSQVCQKLGLGSLPRHVYARVLIFLDDELWPVQDLALREVYHGTYIRAHIPLGASESCNIDLGQGPGSISPTISFEVTTGTNPNPAQAQPVSNSISVIAQFEPGTILTTWFINHRFHRVCLIPRAVTVGLDPRVSLSNLCQAWIDLCDLGSPLAVHVVTQVPISRSSFPYGLRPHIILEQEQFDGRTAGLLSLAQSEFQTYGPPLQALSLPSWVSGSVLLDIAGVALPCLRTLDCYAFADDRPLHPIGRDKTRSGAFYRFDVHPKVPPSPQPEHDFNSLVQLSLDQLLPSSTPSASASGPVETPPEIQGHMVDLFGLTVIFEDSEYLWGIWQEYAATEMLEEGPVAYFTTFFVKPSAPVCHRSRPARLLQDLAQWHEEITSVWHDMISPEHNIHVFPVFPRPPVGINSGRAGHLVVIQELQVDQKVYHLTEIGQTNRPVYTVQFAPNFVDKVRVLYDSARLDDCMLPSYRCRAWYHHRELHHEAIPSYDGLGLVLTIQRSTTTAAGADISVVEDEASPYDVAVGHATVASTPWTGSSASPGLPAESSHGESSQPPPTTVPLCLDSLISTNPRPVTASLDFAPVLSVYQQVLQTELPTLDAWPTHLGWKSELQDQLLSLPLWNGQQPLSFQFYTDGSRTRSNLGAGVIMMVTTTQATFLGGILADRVSGLHNGHAEHNAMAWALLWAIKTAHWHRQASALNPIHFSFNFDATTTASLASGHWIAHVDAEWKRLLRSLELLLRSLCGDAITWNHIYAHQGHLLNEGADSLAKFAATSLPSYEHPFATWILPSFVKPLEWAWMLPLGLPVSAESGLCSVPVSPPAQVSHAKCPTPKTTAPEQQVSSHELWLRLATANVLTVGSADDATSLQEPVIGARQTILIKQFLRERFHVVGVQETRHRTQHCFETDDVVGLAHPALPSGHEGIQIWFNKKDRFCSTSRDRGGARLDYVGLPYDEDIRSVRSWVSDSIDVSTTRIDHYVACCEHILQEKVAFDTQHLHEQLLLELRDQQRIEPCASSVPALGDRPFACEVCLESFATRQSLAQHRYRVHHLHSDESMFIHSTRCGGCLRNFHTTHRMLQHLKYVPNGCLWKMQTFRIPDTPHRATLDGASKHVARLPCERDVSGPLLPNPSQHARSQLLTKLWHLKFHPWFHALCTVASDMPDWVPRFHCALASRVVPPLDSPADIMHAWLDDCLQLTLDFTDDHLSGGIVLFRWIDCHFHGRFSLPSPPDHLPDCPPGERILWDFFRGLDGVELCWTYSALLEALDSPLEEPSPSPDSQSKPRTRVHLGNGPVPSQFALLDSWETSFRDAWNVCAAPVPAQVRVSLQLVVHVYSGPRRSGDFQWWMENFVGQHRPNVQFLSIDTAIHQCYNVLQGGVWTFLMQAASQGAIIALLCGPPCESWSAARALQLLDDEGHPVRGPRPLRDRGRLWGKHGLTAKELRQLHIGTVLLLMALRLATRVAHTQGKVILEHPGLPFDDQQASIWYTQILDLLTEGCGLFSVMDIYQYLFGSPAVKPTRLLYANLPLHVVLPQLERRDFS
eukprot:Skav231972  [mRNA]  locus=scaffold2806:372207:383447:+ [translate_table: standard]